MKWHDEWKGTTAEINDTIEFYLNEIMNEYNVDRKTAKKYLCEALSRNNIVSDVKTMCEYLKQTYLGGEINMNRTERIAALKAMALLARAANDETAIDYWLTYGIADGDEDSDEELDYYTEDDTFKDIIKAFLETMRQSEGLYIDSILGA